MREMRYDVIYTYILYIYIYCIYRYVHTKGSVVIPRSGTVEHGTVSPSKVEDDERNKKKVSKSLEAQKD